MRAYLFGSLSFALLACAGEAPPAQAPVTETFAPAPAPAAADSEPAPPPPAADDAPNLTMTRMTVDGLELSDVACRTQGDGLGGFLGGLAVGAGFKARKAQLDACSKSPVETRVTWVGAEGRMTQIHAEGASAPVSRCVERALRDAFATTTGPCAATVKHGG